MCRSHRELEKVGLMCFVKVDENRSVGPPLHVVSLLILPRNQENTYQKSKVEDENQNLYRFSKLTYTSKKLLL